jgi:hypothetical protein
MYNNRKKLVTEQKERINKLRYDIDDIASDMDEQVYQGMKQADPRSTKESFAGANLDDVVRATDRKTANYGFVVGIDDANTYVRFTSPEGSEKVVEFAHDLSGSAPKINKNIRVHHKAGSAGAKKQARQQSTSIVNNLMRYLAEAPETLHKLKPSAAARLVDNALAEHASFLRSSPETVANIRDRLLNTAAEATDVKDSVFEAVRRYGVPSKELTKFADILDPATGHTQMSSSSTMHCGRLKKQCELRTFHRLLGATFSGTSQHISSTGLRVESLVRN